MCFLLSAIPCDLIPLSIPRLKFNHETPWYLDVSSVISISTNGDARNSRCITSPFEGSTLPYSIIPKSAMSIIRSFNTATSSFYYSGLRVGYDTVIWNQIRSCTVQESWSRKIPLTTTKAARNDHANMPQHS